MNNSLSTDMLKRAGPLMRKSTFAAFDAARDEILALIEAGKTQNEIATELSFSFPGYIAVWFAKRYGCNLNAFRNRMLLGSAAIAKGDVYFFSAPPDLKRRVVKDLIKRNPTVRGKVPSDGEFHIWTFENNVICVSNASEYPSTGEIYQRVFHDDLSYIFEGYGGMTQARIGSPEYSEIPLSHLDIAAQFGIIWIPFTKSE